MTRTRVWWATSLVLGAALLGSCGSPDFPTTPSPVADTPVTTLQGSRYSGTVVLATGATTPINVTLIARALGATAAGAPVAQTPGTTTVNGTFETGSGLAGMVTGNLDGTLERGTFRGTLSIEGGCSREYEGPVAVSSLSWLPFGPLAPGCPLTFAIHTTRTGGPACSVTFAGNTAISGNGGTLALDVTTGESCTWAAETAVPWVQVVGPATGTGSGTLTLSIASNAEGARTASLRIAQQTLTINQGPACVYSVAPSSLAFGGAGESVQVTVTAPELCEWIVAGLPDWLAASPASGAGGGTVQLTAAANAGAQRQASFTVAGQPVTAVQQPAPPPPVECALTVAPPSVSVPAGGGSGAVDVTVQAECAWTAEADVPWIQLTSAASGTGSGRLTFSVAANTGAARTGAIRVNGQTVTVSQPAAAPPEPPCTYALATNTITIGAAGGTGSITVKTAAHCVWSAQTFSDFLGVDPPASFRGTATATFLVLPNTTGAPRVGRLRVAGQDLTVTQLGPTGTINVTLVGPGSVSSEPGGLFCKGTVCTGTFPIGSTVTLFADPGASSRFEAWDGLCGQFENARSCTLTVAAGTNNVVATFTELATLNVQILTEGNAGGNVSSLGLFNCDRTGAPPQSGVCSATLPVGSAVILYAGFTVGTSQFGGWTNCPEVDADGPMSCRVVVQSGTTTVQVSFVPPPPVIN